MELPSPDLIKDGIQYWSLETLTEVLQPQCGFVLKRRGDPSFPRYCSPAETELVLEKTQTGQKIKKYPVRVVLLELPISKTDNVNNSYTVNLDTERLVKQAARRVLTKIIEIKK